MKNYPKFLIGDKVQSRRSGKVYTVYDNKDIYNYRFLETSCPLPESALKLYK